ncbi:BREX system ATP-binding domain-containing protein [Methanobrevibacter filiformis]|uniref:Archaeal ATPase n=1 Tax=Methanobrevibacter filiformis TaxID=55758 RepID=A0A166CPR3_9EURY|nr:BREX system ATP-binding domain-containing protein [Methanobrevibacter filiformis]KZX14738.1 archaeal ATPase [Methanobrevibacter filiformis]
MKHEKLISSLKNGNVPSEDVSSLCIGREREIKEFENLFKKAKNGEAFTKFIYGEFGAGKSFFLKIIEELALKNKFAVSWISLGNDLPFNKIDVVYKNIAQNLRAKTGTSLDHIINRWLSRLKRSVAQGELSEEDRIEFLNENISQDLESARYHSNSFAMAIEHYHKSLERHDQETADYARAWLRGDSNIPFVQKKKFGVKGDIDKENAFRFLKALSSFVNSVGYSGLVVLIDEAEYIMNLHTQKIRDTAYNYIRDIYDGCDRGVFQNTIFIFAGTPEFFDDPNKGIPSYKALNERIEDTLDSDVVDLRKPIITLKGFKHDELNEIAIKIIELHEKAYDWAVHDRIQPIIPDIIRDAEENAELSGKEVNPRNFIKAFVSLLDAIEQNSSEFTKPEDILKVYMAKESELQEELEDDDW